MRLILAGLAALFAASCALAQSAKVDLLFLGQAALRIATPQGQVIALKPGEKAGF